MISSYYFSNIDALLSGDSDISKEIQTLIVCEISSILKLIKKAIKGGDFWCIYKIAGRIMPILDLLNMFSLSDNFKKLEIWAVHDRKKENVVLIYYNIKVELMNVMKDLEND